MKKGQCRFFGSNRDESDRLIGTWVLTQATRLVDEQWLPVKDEYAALRCLRFLSDNIFIERTENADKKEIENWGRYVTAGDNLSLAYVEADGAVARDNAYMSTIVEHTSTELVIRTATCLPRQLFTLHFVSSEADTDFAR